MGGSVLFCSVSVWLDAGLFKNTVIVPLFVLGGPGGPGQLVKKLTTRPSTSAYEHSAGGGYAIARHGECLIGDGTIEHRNPPGTTAPEAPLSTAILFFLQFSDGFAAPSGCPVKVDWWTGGLSTAWR
jgi:hypothetical protein